VQATPATSSRVRAELLLPTLMELKSWVRRLGQHLHSEHRTATLATLALVERHGPARVSDLAEIARVDTSVVSRIAKVLEQSGLVERHSDPADGRAHRLEISADGRDVLGAGRREMADHMAARLSGWSDAELEELNSSLLRLLRDLGRTAAEG